MHYVISVQSAISVLKKYIVSFMNSLPEQMQVLDKWRFFDTRPVRFCWQGHPESEMNVPCRIGGLNRRFQAFLTCGHQKMRQSLLMTTCHSLCYKGVASSSTKKSTVRATQAGSAHFLLSVSRGQCFLKQFGFNRRGTLKVHMRIK